MQLTQESLQAQIPYYLTQKAKDNLVDAINKFPKGINYYTLLYPNELLQGDGWSSLELIRIQDGQKKLVKGIIISNSCDIDYKNIRDKPSNLVFAPILRLSKYLSSLEGAGKNIQEIQNKADAIRGQKVTNLFYLPKGGSLEDEYIALLDDLHTLPVSMFHNQSEKKKVFTLSQVGFYIFLFKLSVHFCRFHEELDRDSLTF